MYNHTVRRPNSYSTRTDRETGKVEERDGLQCVHCGHHWEVIAGSGRTRGFCLLCYGPTCGAQRCVNHYPFEKQLDDYEAGKLIVLQ